MKPEMLKELETYLADRSKPRHVEATLAYEGGCVTITGISVAGGPRREMSYSTEFNGPRSGDNVRTAIDRVIEVLGSP